MLHHFKPLQCRVDKEMTTDTDTTKRKQLHYQLPASIATSKSRENHQKPKFTCIAYCVHRLEQLTSVIVVAEEFKTVLEQDSTYMSDVYLFLSTV